MLTTWLEPIRMKMLAKRAAASGVPEKALPRIGFAPDTDGLL
jgi:hypothetical protein